MTRTLIVGLLLIALAPNTAWAQQSASETDKPDRLILLGTRGGPRADADRSEPASLLVIDGNLYLVDAGTGTARRLAEAGYPLSRIHTIFITHHHLDHTAGLEPIISLHWIDAGLSGMPVKPVNIYGPPATQFLVKAAMDYLDVSQRIYRAGIPSLPTANTMFVGHDMEPGPIYSDDKLTVTAVENSHFGHPSTGPDGKRDMSFSYRFETRTRSIVFTGDTGPSDAVNRFARGADVLVSEVFVPLSGAPTGNNLRSNKLGRELAEHMAREHLSPAEVGKMAQSAGVGQVILTHLVIDDTPAVIQQLQEGVHEYFKGPVIVGRDLMGFDLGAMKVEDR